MPSVEVGGRERTAEAAPGLALCARLRLLSCSIRGGSTTTARPPPLLPLQAFIPSKGRALRRCCASSHTPAAATPTAAQAPTAMPAIAPADRPLLLAGWCGWSCRSRSTLLRARAQLSCDMLDFRIPTGWPLPKPIHPSAGTAAHAGWRLSGGMITLPAERGMPFACKFAGAAAHLAWK